MFEWTRSWWDMFAGEKYLMIANNAEHSMATGIVELLGSLGNFANSVFRNGTRPQFSWDMDLQNGVITVTIPENVKHGKVVLRTAPTLDLKRRLFKSRVGAVRKTTLPCLRFSGMVTVITPFCKSISHENCGRVPLRNTELAKFPSEPRSSTMPVAMECSALFAIMRYFSPANMSHHDLVHSNI